MKSAPDSPAGGTAGHTPGPWSIDRGNTVIIPFNGPHSVAAAYCGTEANARLIAAAPDYDAFVRGITDDLGFAEWATPEHAEEILQALIDKWHPQGRAAIAKAASSQ